MTAQSKKIRVAAVGDLHTHKTRPGEHRQLFADVSKKADVLALCGDLTHLGAPEEAETLAADLSVLKIPIVAVLGNHDHHSGKIEEVKRILGKANVTFLEDEAFQFGGVGFAGVKGFGGGFGNHMLGSFGEEATKNFVAAAVQEALALEHSLVALNNSRIVVVLHYSPIFETVKGEPAEIVPFLGCSRLAETIDRFQVTAVFHGHAHHGVHKGQTMRGVPVYNCSSHVLRRVLKQPFLVVEV